MRFNGFPCGARLSMQTNTRHKKVKCFPFAFFPRILKYWSRSDDVENGSIFIAFKLFQTTIYVVLTLVVSREKKT